MSSTAPLLPLVASLLVFFFLIFVFALYLDKKEKEMTNLDIDEKMKRDTVRKQIHTNQKLRILFILSMGLIWSLGALVPDPNTRIFVTTGIVLVLVITFITYGFFKRFS